MIGFLTTTVFFLLTMLCHCFFQEEVRFHLYINTAPCGDARIFSPHEPGKTFKNIPKGAFINDVLQVGEGVSTLSYCEYKCR